ncbi:MAG: hypothetical protein WBD95_06375, partial [Xanthobacteraceae bacterium]
QEQNVKERPEWTQKVTDAIVRAHIYASKNKAEIARMISRDGKGYLPTPSDVVEKAVTDYARTTRRAAPFAIATGTTAASTSSLGHTLLRRSLSSRR